MERTILIMSAPVSDDESPNIKKICAQSGVREQQPQLHPPHSPASLLLSMSPSHAQKTRLLDSKHLGHLPPAEILGKRGAPNSVRARTRVRAARPRSATTRVPNIKSTPESGYGNSSHSSTRPYSPASPSGHLMSLPHAQVHGDRAGK